MFGFGKKEKAVDDSERYMRTMFGGLDMPHGKPVPNQVFGDPYVAAFLQALTLHATATVYHGQMPDQQTIASIMSSALERLVPGFGMQIVNGVLQIGNASHPLHANYQVGRAEGMLYAKSLVSGDEATAHEAMRSFREFVTLNYLAVR